VVLGILFFFQAEDGIRDRNVTGVQTCALPISDRSPGPGAGWRWASGGTGGARSGSSAHPSPRSSGRRRGCSGRSSPAGGGSPPEIGRASCRERELFEKEKRDMQVKAVGVRSVR